MPVEPLVKVCSWCVRDGLAVDQPGASHGMCREHAIVEVVTPRLHVVIARLRGGAYLGDVARQELAEKLAGIVRLLGTK